MILFLCVFTVCFFVVCLFRVSESIKRIADAIEDFVYDDEDDTEESEVKQ
jgi:hypothetical protein